MKGIVVELCRRSEMGEGECRREWEHDEEGTFNYKPSISIFEIFQRELRPVLKSGRPIHRRPGVRTKWVESKSRLNGTNDESGSLGLSSKEICSIQGTRIKYKAIHWRYICYTG